MHGSSTLKEDQEVIGVQVSDQCSCQEEDQSERDEVTQHALDMALNEAIELLRSRSLVVVTTQILTEMFSSVQKIVINDVLVLI
jgi:1-aminocyclopropane-1-carboxylate deaminase/D-cysteine desulfhydrase-like pyridoxal-dependent ACC family enzyme